LPGDIFTRIQALCKEEYDCESLIVLALGKQHVRAVDAAKMRGVIRAGIEKQYLASVNFVKK
jgi:hypothetical protein